MQCLSTLLSFCCSIVSFFFLTTLPSPRPTLFPYTTLFRSTSLGQFSGRVQQTYKHSVPRFFVPEHGTMFTLALVQEQRNRSEERFSRNAETDLVCRLLLEKKKKRVTKLAKVIATISLN